MSRSLHKSTLDFLICRSKEPVIGNHLRRLTILSSMICSCVRSKKCSLEGLSMPEQVDERQSESRIQQVKRWISSKWTDWAFFFAPYLTQLLSKLSSRGELVLIIDGSETGQGCVTLLLSVVWKNYAIPIIWLTRKGAKGHFPDAIHTQLLQDCQCILPNSDSCRIVLLGDGEFDGPQLRNFCRTNHWEFVLRTSLDRKIDFGNGAFDRIDALIPLLQNQQIIFIEDACQADHAILWKGKGFKDPIPILTNMELGYMAYKYYKLRFKIETLFKQMKSAGFQLHKSMLSNPDRIQNLILVIALAFIFTFCVGLLLQEKPRQLIACFARTDRYLKMSPITLAQKAFAHHSDLAYYLFSILSKNFEDFFDPIT